MEFQNWLGYFFATLLLIISPGPIFMVVLNNGLRYGRKAMSSVFASVTSSLLLMVLAALGLAQVMQSYPNAALVLRTVGIFYLAYLGISSWRHATETKNTDSEQVEAVSSKSLYFKTLSIGLSNPSDLIFYSVFLPNFLSTEYSTANQLSVMCSTLAVIDLAVMSAVCLMATRIAGVFTAGNTLVTIKKVSAALMLALSIALLWSTLYHYANMGIC